MRGQPVRRFNFLLRTRIIPARAGPTRASCTRSNVRQDHPRSCGANYVTDLEGLKDCGSSPLVRGQQVAISSLERLIRIIPARAGPTLIGCIGMGFMTDHPRSCGANAMTGYSNRVTIGSSPLVRGQPIHVNKRLVLLDHPRSCGANDSLYHRLDFAHGSSPLVRGQRRGRTLAVHGERIIPARAGPTCIAGQVPWCSTDHPRSCGANPTIYLVSFFCSGSSPLVRGQPLR